MSKVPAGKTAHPKVPRSYVRIPNGCDDRARSRWRKHDLISDDPETFLDQEERFTELGIIVGCEDVPEPEDEIIADVRADDPPF